jgi:hypothetical protein
MNSAPISLIWILIQCLFRIIESSNNQRFSSFQTLSPSIIFQIVRAFQIKLLWRAHLSVALLPLSHVALLWLHRWLAFAATGPLCCAALCTSSPSPITSYLQHQPGLSMPFSFSRSEQSALLNRHWCRTESSFGVLSSHRHPIPMD